ncbi:ABC transporter permease [Actibacterium sp. MT2.3-13A]|uniref:ABC transporter permease n=1 Tax=Actibacterium sp. MT2.3-13A TaxID=2828332 RepID=UPI001BA64D56|nr:ABC transporter permease [Actibacterium sp. MT2.3-13A]
MTAVTDAPAVPQRPRSRVWTKLRANPSALLGAVLVIFFVVVAILAPLLPIPGPLETDWLAVRKPPSAAHPFGTDEIGRDVLSRMVWGAQASLLAGVVSVLIALALGIPLGVAAGYARGWTDAVISRVTEALLAAPFLILAIALAAFLGPSLTNAMIAIGLSAMPVFIRLARGQTMTVMTEDYVESARAIGLSHLAIIWRYILPNIFPPLLVQATLTVATAIIAEASLSFLGLGQQPPSPSWGSMLNIAKNFLEQAPWMAMWPGIAIFLVVLGFNLLGDGLRDALDPRDH